MNIQEEVPKTTILVETKTREKLRLLGSKGESYDTIILRLIKHWEDTH